MTLIILFGFLLSAGSALGAACFKRRYEEWLPVSCAGIVVILFGFGLAGALKAGFYAVIILCAAAWLTAIGYALFTKTCRAFLRRLLTPGFFFFALLLALLYGLNRGKLADEIDEFSNWVSVVKVMTVIDGFGANQPAAALYASYPPGVALFEYFFQKAALLLSPDAGFREDLVYLALQVYSLSFLFPFLSGLRLRRLSAAPLMALTISALPLIMFFNAYSCAYIDPFLGLCGGAGLAMVFNDRQSKGKDRPAIVAALLSLTLAKDSGLSLALFVLAAWVIQADRKRWIALTGLAAVILPRLLWTGCLAALDVPKSFPFQMDWAALGRLITFRESGYRHTVAVRFLSAILTYQLPLGDTNFGMAYPPFCLITLALLYGVCRGRRRALPEGWPVEKRLFWLTALFLPVYALGLLAIYLFSFVPADALCLGGMHRYCRAAMLVPLTAAVILGVQRLQALPNDKRNPAAALCLCALMLAMPWSSVDDFVTRASVTDSIELRQPYVDFKAAVAQRLPEKDQRTFYVGDGDGMDYFILRHELYPRLVNGDQWRTWTVEADPSYLLAGYTPEQWRQELLAGYDQVALFRLPEGFMQRFSQLFADPETIGENRLYRLNRETGLLEWQE